MSKTQNKVIKFLESKGYLVLKTIRLNKNGYPDLFAMKKNKPNLWIEIKEEKDTLKPLQKHRIDELNMYGNFAVCYHATKGIIYPLIFSDLTLNEII